MVVQRRIVKTVCMCMSVSRVLIKFSFNQLPLSVLHTCVVFLVSKSSYNVWVQQSATDFWHLSSSVVQPCPQQAGPQKVKLSAIEAKLSGSFLGTDRAIEQTTGFIPFISFPKPAADQGNLSCFDSARTPYMRSQGCSVMRTRSELEGLSCFASEGTETM
jgi:hypothetical protein